MADAIGQILALGVGVALSPIPIIAVELMFGTPRVAIYLALGDRAERRLDELKLWLGEHNSAILGVLCLVIGAKLIGDGIGGLG